MAQSDFTAPTGVLTNSSVLRVETTAFTPPNGGGLFLQAYKSIAVATGVMALFYNGSGFAPTPATKGGIASMALNRATSGGAGGWAPFVFVNLGGTNVSNEAYILGIGDATPGHLILRKGALSGGLPDVDPGAASPQGVIWRSDEVIALNEWAHVRLMVAGNANGDAVISVWRSALATHALSSPTWVAVAGQRIAQGGGTVAATGITDDGAGILTGSPAFTSGYMGYGVYVSNTARVALVDGFACEAQP